MLRLVSSVPHSSLPPEHAAPVILRRGLSLFFPVPVPAGLDAAKTKTSKQCSALPDYGVYSGI